LGQQKQWKQTPRQGTEQVHRPQLPFAEAREIPELQRLEPFSENIGSGLMPWLLPPLPLSKATAM